MAVWCRRPTSGGQEQWRRDGRSQPQPHQRLRGAERGPAVRVPVPVGAGWRRPQPARCAPPSCRAGWAGPGGRSRLNPFGAARAPARRPPGHRQRCSAPPGTVQRGAVAAAGDAAPSPCPAACGRRGCCKCSVTAPRWQPARRCLLLLALLYFFFPSPPLFLDRNQRPRARKWLRGMPTLPRMQLPLWYPRPRLQFGFVKIFLPGPKFGADSSPALNSSWSLAGGEREASDDMKK